MSNIKLQIIIIPMILAVIILFAYSVFNPVETFRKDQDAQMISFLQNQSATTSGGLCFKPVSKFYQTDPRSIYNVNGVISVGEGYFCFK